jgi:hypothetical protein
MRQAVAKPLRDTMYHEVQVHRYQCLKCKRTFRAYPEGTTLAQTSQRVKLQAYGRARLSYLQRHFLSTRTALVAGETEVIDARRDLARVRLTIAVGIAERDVGERMDHHLPDRLAVRGVDSPGLLDSNRVGGLPELSVDVEIEVFDRSAQDVATVREIDLVVERGRPVDVETLVGAGELPHRRFRSGDCADQLRRQALGKCRRS